MNNLSMALQMPDKGYFSVVFCGNLAVLDNQNKLPLVWRRILQNRPVIIKFVMKGDVAVFLRYNGTVIRRLSMRFIKSATAAAASEP